MLNVTCGILQDGHKILICQRSATMSQPLKWEFPGGKIEPGESKSDCLQREIREELGIQIEVGREYTRVKHRYTDFDICLYPFQCSIISGVPRPLEHAQVRWVAPEDLLQYDWADADIPIVIEYLYTNHLSR